MNAGALNEGWIMHQCDSNACREYNELSRRQFMGATSAAALIGAGVPAWLPRVVLAQDECTDRDVLVSIYLRGGVDGMTLCVPHAESAYYDARPRLAVPPPDSPEPDRAIDLDGFFGLPPAMGSLKEAFDAGDLAIVHATGLARSTRSHFDAMRFMELGSADDPNLFTGWLGRHLMTKKALKKNSVLRAVGISHALQTTLAGSPQALPIPDLANFGLAGNEQTRDARLELLNALYRRHVDPIRNAAQATQDTIDLLEQIDFVNYRPSGGAVYPNTPFGNALKSAAALIKADVGVEAIAVDKTGWDTHNNQGPLQGAMANLMTDLSNTLAAFHKDVFTDGPNVTVVAQTEFGRRLAENGSLGTDHGYATVMLLLGQYIAGGRVVTEWPGLAPENLFEGIDLDVTLDYRDVLAEIAARRLRNAGNLDFIFPDHTPQFPGVTVDC